MSLLSSGSPTTILPCEDYGSLKKLLLVTEKYYVLKFVANIKNPESNTSTQTISILTGEDIHLAMNYWMKASQATMPEVKNFQQWSGQFGPFQDNNGLWRCGGRLDIYTSNSKTYSPPER